MQYRVYFLSQSDHIKDVDPFVAENDASAIMIAKQRSDGRPMELWSGERLVFRKAPATALRAQANSVD